MLPMAIPGMVLGLAYIFFFNDPRNPLNAIYGTLAILVVCTVTHFYTVSHLTAMTALKQMDREFESVAASLKQPFYRLFRVVTVPVCLPRSEEHTSELQSLMRISYAVFCLKKKKKITKL